ncbi:hypothetical protein SELMODRAFT_431736 [Selaginella moellendorffii]|uniref:Uncharacterized protein n=1 Tax=Selaginella moellendorffii TaxID=88036 RepID=D8TDM0_SELML|nr:hypothetical protein SELMODRAFT_431736 [Selaginella moellendorffii]
MVFHRLLQTKGRILAPVFPIQPDSKVSAIHKRSPGAGCEGLLNPAAMARLALGEALTNLVWAKLEVAIEGGKDSLSMAGQAGGETVKALANLVISHWRGSCSFVGTGKGRLGGFALAQSFDQLPLCGLVILAWTLKYLKRAFNATQGCMKNWAFQAFYTIQKGIILFNQKPCMSLNRGRIRVGNVKSGWKIMVMIEIAALCILHLNWWRKLPEITFNTLLKPRTQYSQTVNGILAFIRKQV